MRTDAAREGLTELHQVLDRLDQALADVPNGRAGALLLAEVLVTADKVGRKLDKLITRLVTASQKALKP